ncbi:uncharacterized protein LOC105166682 isoform X4 [Sesamum indicum]|uniref:Uncharacterized protein LOC105166682 isoform X4 n=1 Tax=Sesamum indicum TaxID=4182 RepID=A0A6I9TME0_SESIN|nr:uncharacterized protein LOC105166682 isoform X4 [Sesamum indicum]
MNALTTTMTFCPSSFQLKLALGSRKYPFAFVRTRLPELERRSLNFVSVVVRSSAVGSNGVGQRSSGNSSWVNANSSADDLSGWANADGEPESGDSKRKQSLVGILGAGAAGVILLVGLTFAALSISKKSTSGVKKEMEPLTTQQEKSLSSDNYEDEAEEEKSKEKLGMLESGGEESKTALQVLPGKVLVPAVVDQLQSQALSALQVLKVIEDDIQPGDLCTRREYARWLVLASSALSRNTTSKVYPAMYIENVSELAFDDITPEDPDFPSIQGLAEAGLIASKLSRRDMQTDEDPSPLFFSPESPLSRQDLVSWKMALEKRQLPIVDRKTLQHVSGFIDIDKIHPDAWPALVADLAAGEQGIITLAFGYTRLFQPEKPVTKAQAAIALSTGEASAIVSEELARIEAESMAEKAVAAHSALVAQVEKDLNASYEKELALEKEKIYAVEKLAEETRREVEKLRAKREEENLSLMKERAAVDSEMELFSRLRREVEEQLQTLMNDKLEISYEKERLNKLRRDAETESQEITRLQYELEVERKALSMARAWAEDEAKRAREQAKALDEARDRWERQGIKVVVDSDLREEAEAGATWLAAGKQFSVEETIERSENLVDKLKKMADEVRGKCKDTINRVIEKIVLLISNLKERAGELQDAAKSKLESSLQRVQNTSAGFTSTVKESVKRAAGDWKEGVERLSQKFKT